MTSRYTSGQAHQRDRTQLFSNVSSYNPSVVINSGSNSATSSRAGTPYKVATPNSKGQYSDQVLSELESQSDEQIEGLTAKVRMLKDVSITHRILLPTAGLCPEAARRGVLGANKIRSPLKSARKCVIPTSSSITW